MTYTSKSKMLLHFATSVAPALLLLLGRHLVHGCTPLPRNGPFIDKIQATSDPLLLVAGISLYDTNFITSSIEATIHLNTGRVTAGWSAPSDVDVFPPGFGDVVDLSDYTIALDHGDNTTGGVPKATITNTAIDAAITVNLPDLQQPSAEGESLFVYWFVSPKVQRSYLFCNNGTAIAASLHPSGFVAIAPLPGSTDDNVEFFPYEDLLEPASTVYSSVDGRLPAYDGLQLVMIPNGPCGMSTVYYSDRGVDLRDVSLGPLSIGGVAVAPDEQGKILYKTKHTIAYPEGHTEDFAIEWMNVPTNENQEIDLNADDVYGLFGFSVTEPSACATLKRLPVVLLVVAELLWMSLF